MTGWQIASVVVVAIVVFNATVVALLVVRALWLDAYAVGFADGRAWERHARARQTINGTRGGLTRV